MTKSILKTSLLLVFVLLFSTCKKYADGPVFSLHSVNKRIWGTYKLEKYIVNGIDSTSLLPTPTIINNLQYAIYDGSYCYKFKSDRQIEGFIGSGNYLLSNDKKEIELDYSCGSSCINPINPKVVGNYWWKILRLTTHDFWLKKEDNNITYEIHFKKLHKL